MKTARQIIVNNRVRTVIKCNNCGALTFTNSGIITKISQRAIERSCRACKQSLKPKLVTSWWKELGLDKNPYVYGPMQRMRTSERYRLEEARRMGWMAWTWNDEYSEERKGSNHNEQRTMNNNNENTLSKTLT